MLVFRYPISATVPKFISPNSQSKLRLSNIDSQIPITIVGAVLIDKSGRKPLIMVDTNIAFILSEGE